MKNPIKGNSKNDADSKTLNFVATRTAHFVHDICHDIAPVSKSSSLRLRTRKKKWRRKDCRRSSNFAGLIFNNRKGREGRPNVGEHLFSSLFPSFPKQIRFLQLSSFQLIRLSSATLSPTRADICIPISLPSETATLDTLF